MTVSLDKTYSPRSDKLIQDPWSLVVQVEECATRKWLAPQEFVVPTKGGAERVWIFAECVGPKVERGIDCHAPPPPTTLRPTLA